MIDYRNDVRASGVDGRALRKAAQALLDATDAKDATIGLAIVDDETIRRLNRDHRRRDSATDVLSFPSGDGQFLGDVVISVETARRQAADYDASLQREVQRLLIHGLLHLMGHDHHRPGERKKMVAEERRLAHRIGMPWPYES